MTSPDDDAKALGEAGYEVVQWRPASSPTRNALIINLLPGDLVVRRKRPPEPESECVTRFLNAVVAQRDPWNGEQCQLAVDAFKAALAREIEAAEQRGYDDGYARLARRPHP
mgnify:CR=1 FL=1